VRKQQSAAVIRGSNRPMRKQQSAAIIRRSNRPMREQKPTPIVRRSNWPVCRPERTVTAPIGKQCSTEEKRTTN
jgi:hypothetical protein